MIYSFAYIVSSSYLTGTGQRNLKKIVLLKTHILLMKMFWQRTSVKCVKKRLVRD